MDDILSLSNLFAVLTPSSALVLECANTTESVVDNIRLENGLERVRDKLRAAVAGDCFWNTEILEHLCHFLNRDYCPAFPSINVKSVTKPIHYHDNGVAM